jgi:uncharacterized protein (DUF302 family)
MLYSRTSNQSFDEVVSRLSQEVVEHQFGVIETIDLQQKMNAKGVPFDSRCTIVEVCNPKKAKQVLDENMSLSTALPCRISVYEQSGKVVISTALPTKLLGMYDDSRAMQEVAQEVETTLTQIIDNTCAEEVVS